MGNKETLISWKVGSRNFQWKWFLFFSVGKP